MFTLSRSSLCVLWTMLFLATPAAADVLINAGGPALGSYIADQYFVGGASYTYGNQSGVYNTDRWSTTSFSYAIPVTPGQIELTLRIRESCTMCPYTRVMRVDAEGQTILSNFSVPMNTVADRTFVITSDATLNLVFTKINGEAWVNAIEVRQLGGGASPPTLSFTANPTSVSSGGSSTLTWSSSNATGCTASGAWSGAKAVSGSQSTGALSSASTFNLSCTGSGGSVTRSITVTVSSPVPTVSLTANPATVTSGNSSTLTWASNNATSCTASGGWSGTRSANGSQSTGPLTTSTVFTLTCTGEGGSASASANVSVSAAAGLMINAGGPALGNYVADQYFIGGSSYTYGNQSGVYNTDRWATTSFSYAIPVTAGQIELTLRFRESCTMCPYTRVIRVDAEGQTILSNFSVPMNTVDDRTFIITSDSTLNLVFTKVNGEVWVNAIEVRQLGGGSSPPTLSFTASPTSVPNGGSSTLTWSATNAASCTASGAWSGAKAVSGSQSTGALTATSAFHLSCTGSGGTVSQSATVNVSASAPTVSLTASPTTVASGGSSTLTWTSTNATSCTASGGWSGSKATSGSQSTGPLTTSTVFTLMCTGAGGSASSSASVTTGGSGGTLFPLQVVSGQRYLVDASGNPFLVHGDAAWSLIVQLDQAEVDTYLENRRLKGFNTVLVNLIEHDAADNPPNNAYGEPPFLTPGDFSTPNPSYFAHAEYVISKAAQKGMLVMLAPAYVGFGGGAQGWYQEMLANGVTRLRAYGQYVANRFLPYDNILWVHGGDYTPPNRDVMRAVVNGINDIDTRWLHTFHGGRGTPALDLGPSDPWVEANNIYTDRNTVVTEAFQEYARSTMPFFLIEADYENGGITPAGVRQQAYQAVLSGATGQIIGHAWVWHFMNGYWTWAMNGNGATTTTYLRTLLESRAWSTLQPDVNGALLTGGTQSGANRAAASLAFDGSFALVYTPTVRTLTIDLRQFAGPRVQARWYDPTTGTYGTIAGSPFNATSTQTFTPSGNNAGGDGDWVLVLESVP